MHCTNASLSYKVITKLIVLQSKFSYSFDMNRTRVLRYSFVLSVIFRKNKCIRIAISLLIASSRKREVVLAQYHAPLHSRRVRDTQNLWITK